MTAIPLNSGSSLPMAGQIACHFRSLIHSGKLQEGDLLPKTDSITNASQPIVLQAYRQLQSEGLVKVRRTHGTVVINGRSQQCFGILLRQTNPKNYPNAFIDSLVLGLMRHAVFHDNAPRVYMLNPLGDKVEDMLPASLLTDLNHNAIAGLFVQPYNDDNLLTDWLRDRKLPFVQLHKTGTEFSTTVAPDNRKLLIDGMRRLLEKDVRRPLVLSTLESIRMRDVATELGQVPVAAIDWRIVGIRSYTAAEVGRGLADEWLARPSGERSDGVLITDDWLAAGFVNRVAMGGGRIPDDLRVVIACHRDQLQTVLADCDCLVLDPLDVVDELINQLKKRLGNPDAPDESIYLPYRLISESSMDKSRRKKECTP